MRTDTRENFFTKNTLERRNDAEVIKKNAQIGIRLDEIQNKHEYLDKDMAKLLKITEDDYINIKSGSKSIDLGILNRFKQLFEVSADWLLYG